MEYIEGENLSSVIRRGPLSPERAVDIAIQLCRFLEEVDRATTGEDGPSRLTLLHNDLKPTNVRLVAGDRVKVLDFGAPRRCRSAEKSRAMISAASRISLRNVWSPASGTASRTRGRSASCSTRWWPVGRRFGADDTRRLENRIRSRRPPDAIVESSDALRAVIAKLLAPYPEDRYENASAIRADLERLRLDVTTVAEGEGWPNRPRMRRRRGARRIPRCRPAADRRSTGSASADLSMKRRRAEPKGEKGEGAGRRPHSRGRPKTRAWRRCARSCSSLAAPGRERGLCVRPRESAGPEVPTQSFAGMTDVWAQHDAIAGWSFLGGLGVGDLRRAIARQSLILAERHIANYRTPAPSVREAQWQEAADALRHALSVAPNDAELRGALRYVEGHLHRINGEATKPGAARRKRRSVNLPMPSRRFATPPNCDRTGPIRFWASRARSSTAWKTSTAASTR